MICCLPKKYFESDLFFSIVDGIMCIHCVKSFDEINKALSENKIHTVKFGDTFNLNIDYILFPKDLHTIVFGRGFNKSIDEVLIKVLMMFYFQINYILLCLDIVLIKT